MIILRSIVISLNCKYWWNNYWLLPHGKLALGGVMRDTVKIFLITEEHRELHYISMNKLGKYLRGRPIFKWRLRNTELPHVTLSESLVAKFAFDICMNTFHSFKKFQHLMSLFDLFSKLLLSYTAEKKAVLPTNNFTFEDIRRRYSKIFPISREYLPAKWILMPLRCFLKNY